MQHLIQVVVCDCLAIDHRAEAGEGALHLDLQIGHAGDQLRGDLAAAVQVLEQQRLARDQRIRLVRVLAQFLQRVVARWFGDHFAPCAHLAGILLLVLRVGGGGNQPLQLIQFDQDRLEISDLRVNKRLERAWHASDCTLAVSNFSKYSGLNCAAEHGRIGARGRNGVAGQNGVAGRNGVRPLPRGAGGRERSP